MPLSFKVRYGAALLTRAVLVCKYKLKLVREIAPSLLELSPMRTEATALKKQKKSTSKQGFLIYKHRTTRRSGRSTG